MRGTQFSAERLPLSSGSTHVLTVFVCSSRLGGQSGKEHEEIV